jgi:tetratricopeptide (TPR) repeat protein
MKEPSGSTRAQCRQQWLERVDLALRTDGLQVAAQLAQQALAEGVEDASLMNLAASALYRERRFDEATQLLKHARSLAPRDPDVLNSLGICLRALGRTEEALQVYEAALRIDPGMAPAHFNRGAVLNELNDIGAARAAYERAADLNERYAEPLAALASLDAKAGDAVSARALGARALALAPSNVAARLAMASAELQQGDFAAAAERLSALRQDSSLTPVNRSIVLSLTGDLHDAESRPSEAFSAYAASNAELRNVNAPRFEAPRMTTALEQTRQLIGWFDAADPEPWREEAAVRPRAADPKAHVFLVGFPRSGTTLLENVLAAHSEVVSLEEKDCLASVAAPYLTPEGLQRLARINPGEAARKRDAYWSCVREHGVEPRGRVFVDKMPLSSGLLPIVAKLFPGARVLFARRDPRDVVLSCFRRRFGMNASMYQLLTLEGAAAYYDAIMKLSAIYRELLPLPLLEVRYESLVDDFETTVTSVSKFLGIGWEQAMLDFAANARRRDISTPSAAQVVRGLNRAGQGAWRRYREQMAPVLPLLEPWVRRFGYEPS